MTPHSTSTLSKQVAAKTSTIVCSCRVGHCAQCRVHAYCIRGGTAVRGATVTFFVGRLATRCCSTNIRNTLTGRFPTALKSCCSHHCWRSRRDATRCGAVRHGSCRCSSSTCVAICCAIACCAIDSSACRRVVCCACWHLSKAQQSNGRQTSDTLSGHYDAAHSRTHVIASIGSAVSCHT